MDERRTCVVEATQALGKNLLRNEFYIVIYIHELQKPNVENLSYSITSFRWHILESKLQKGGFLNLGNNEQPLPNPNKTPNLIPTHDEPSTSTNGTDIPTNPYQPQESNLLHTPRQLTLVTACVTSEWRLGANLSTTVVDR